MFRQPGGGSERRRRRLLRPWDGAHSCAVSPGVSEGSGRYGWRGRRWWGRELGAVSAPQRPICRSLASSLRCCASGGFCGGVLPASQRATCTRAASSTRRFALPLELVAGHGPGYAALETNSLAIHRTVLSSTRVCTSSPSATTWQRMLASAKRAAIFGGIALSIPTLGSEGSPPVTGADTAAAPLPPRPASYRAAVPAPADPEARPWLVSGRLAPPRSA